MIELTRISNEISSCLKVNINITEGETEDTKQMTF